MLSYHPGTFNDLQRKWVFKKQYLKIANLLKNYHTSQTRQIAPVVELQPFVHL